MRTDGRGCRGAESHATHVKPTRAPARIHRTFHAPVILTREYAGVSQPLVVGSRFGREQKGAR